jgi:hypothetical protein
MPVIESSDERRQLLLVKTRIVRRHQGFTADIGFALLHSRRGVLGG